MGLFSTDVDPDLVAARKQVVATERACPACGKTFTAKGDTLVAYNKGLAIETHRCPACGYELWVQVANPKP